MLEAALPSPTKVHMETIVREHAVKSGSLTTTLFLPTKSGGPVGKNDGRRATSAFIICL